MTKLQNRRHDATGRSTGRPANRRLAKWLGPPKGEPWCWFTKEMLSSEGFRSLSRMALQALFRLVFEHLEHAGTENGNLTVTYNDFVVWGIRRTSISDALRELERAGFVRVVVKGGLSYGEARVPSRYRLTWLPTSAGDPPTNEWKAFKLKKAPDTVSGLVPDTLP